MLFDNFNKNINRDRNPFLDKVSSSLIRDCLNNIQGSSICKGSKKSVISALGEYFERLSFIKNIDLLADNVIYGIGILNSKIYKINNNDKYYNSYFADTSGCACHINSISLIENSYLEFIERQSFVFRYLTKTVKYKLKISEKLELIIPQIFKDFDFFNISLIDSCYVILAIGILDGNFYLGLGSNYNLDVAFKKSINELYQLKDNFCKIKNKVNSKYSEDYFKNNYFDYYYIFTTERLKNAYSFLYNTDEKLVKKLDDYYNFDISIKELSDLYNINPILFFLPSSKGVKVSKIIDLNWFPSVNPNDFSEKTLLNIEKITGLNIDRKCNYIPIP